MKIKTKEIAPLRESLLQEQGGYCAICCKVPVRPVLDHNHAHPGNIRGVLCNLCNTMEGRIYNNHKRHKIDDLPSWLRQLATYLEKHNENPSTSIHPTYLTQDEKNERRKRINTRRRKQLKEQK